MPGIPPQLCSRSVPSTSPPQSVCCCEVTLSASSTVLRVADAAVTSTNARHSFMVYTHTHTHTHTHVHTNTQIRRVSFSPCWVREEQCMSTWWPWRFSPLNAVWPHRNSWSGLTYGLRMPEPSRTIHTATKQQRTSLRQYQCLLF